MRVLCAHVLIVTLFFALSGPAHAGAFTVPPVTANACGDFDVAEDTMIDPDTAFINAETPELCAKLCKRAVKLCGTYVNDVAACRRRVYTNTRTFGKLNCESALEEPAQQKQCKINVDDEFDASLQFHKAEQASQRELCGTWGETCSAACHL